VVLSVNRSSTGDIQIEHRSDDSTFANIQSTAAYRTLNDGNWHHVAAVRSASNSFTLYVDGVSQGTTTTAPSTTTVDRPTIGASRSTTTTGYFPGQLDDIRVYVYPLSPTQIKQVMNEGASVRYGPSTGSP
jgi:hypothetical protein